MLNYMIRNIGFLLLRMTQIHIENIQTLLDQNFYQLDTKHRMFRKSMFQLDIDHIL